MSAHECELCGEEPVDVLEVRSGSDLDHLLDKALDCSIPDQAALRILSRVRVRDDILKPKLVAGMNKICRVARRVVRASERHSAESVNQPTLEYLIRLIEERREAERHLEEKEPAKIAPTTPPREPLEVREAEHAGQGLCASPTAARWWMGEAAPKRERMGRR